MKKKLLIFTNVNDHQDQFLSWATYKNDIYDRVLTYYGHDPERKKFLESLNTEYFFYEPGAKGVITSFANKYESLFKNQYEYYLTIDTDLIANSEQIIDTLQLAIKNDWSACQWSREATSHGYWVPNFIQNTNKNYIQKTIFLEVLFIMCKSTLMDLWVETIITNNIIYPTGTALLLSNIALNNDMLPFYVIHQYSFYNPHPTDNKTLLREIDHGTQTTTRERIEPVLNLMETNKTYFRIELDQLTYFLENHKSF